MKRIAIFAFFFIPLLFSCTSKAFITINKGNVIVQVDNQFTPAAVELKDDFNAILQNKIELEEETDFEITLSEFEELLNTDDSNKILWTEINDNTTTYHININADNYMNLECLFPMINDENISQYTAKYNKDETEESYLELIDFVAGKFIKNDFINSYSTAIIKTKGKIINLEGENCKILNDNEIEIKISALQAALLHSSININFTTLNDNN